MTTALSEHYPVLTKVFDLFDDWLKQRQELNELRECAADPANLERVARELKVTPAELEILVRRWPRAADELPQMLRALGIDEVSLWRAEPALLLDMERVCSLCQHKHQCRQELAVGTAPANYVEYCRNADTFDAVRLES
jgi:hypothetical protein